MKRQSHLAGILLLFASLLSGCGNPEGSFKPTPYLEDSSSKASNPNAAEIASDAQQSSARTIASTTESSQSVAVAAPDDSQIKSMEDGFGNSTQSRTFYSDPLVKMVTLRTSKNGFQQALVYANNGQVSELPADLTASSMTLSAVDIGKHVRIVARPVKEQSTIPVEAASDGMWTEANSDPGSRGQASEQAARVSIAKNDQADSDRPSASDEAFRLRRKLNVFDSKPQAIRP